MQARFQELEIVPNPQFSHITPATLLCYLLTPGLQPHSDKETINHCVQFHLKGLNLLLPDRNNKYYKYYSFRIFPQFRLAKSTRFIHHNQLLMPKSGRISCLTRKWRQNCSLLQVNEQFTEKTWGRGWVVLVVKTKMIDTSLVSRVITTAGTRQSNS